MGDRKSQRELQLIKDNRNVSKLWSWSRLKTVRDDPYGYFLRYIKNEPEDMVSNVYSALGNIVHDLVEELQQGNITNEQALETFKDKSLEFAVMGFTFNREDEDRNDSIGARYNTANEHFLTHFEPLQGDNIKCEEFIEAQIDKQVLIGYVDFSREITDNGGNLQHLDILDWKTSTIYRGNKIDKEKGQLLLYALAKTQQGYPLDKIRCGWVFTKYVDVDIELKNGKTRTSSIERDQIGSKLHSSVKGWLTDKKLGLNLTEQEVEGYLEEMVESNSIDCLPQVIKDKYAFNTCIVYASVKQDDIDEMKKELKDAIVKAITLEMEYEKTGDDKIWWQEIKKQEEYFYANLSGYSKMKHLPWQEYLKNKEMFLNQDNDEEDLDIDDLLNEFLD